MKEQERLEASLSSDKLEDQPGTGDALALNSAERLICTFNIIGSLGMTAFMRIHNQYGASLNDTIKERETTLCRQIQKLDTATAVNGSPFVPPQNNSKRR